MTFKTTFLSIKLCAWKENIYKTNRWEKKNNTSCSKPPIETTEKDQEDWCSSCGHVHDGPSEQISIDASVAAVLLDLGFHFDTLTRITRTDLFDGKYASAILSTDFGKSLVKYKITHNCLPLCLNLTAVVMRGEKVRRSMTSTQHCPWESFSFALSATWRCHFPS